VVGLAFEHPRLARGAGALQAGRRHVEPGSGKGGQDGLLRADGDDLARAVDHHVESGIGRGEAGVGGRRPEALHVQRARPAPLVPFLDGGEQRFGAAAVDGRPVGGRPEDLVKGQQAVAVGGTERTAPVVAVKLAGERHMRPRPCAVVQPPVGARRVRGRDHRQQRRDPDAARDEHVPGPAHQRKVVPRQADGQLGAVPDLPVQVAGAAAAVLLQQHRDAPGPPIGGVTAQ
jgi:hypothetical protein